MGIKLLTYNKHGQTNFQRIQHAPGFLPWIRICWKKTTYHFQHCRCMCDWNSKCVSNMGGRGSFTMASREETATTTITTTGSIIIIIIMILNIIIIILITITIIIISSSSIVLILIINHQSLQENDRDLQTTINNQHNLSRSKQSAVKSIIAQRWKHQRPAGRAATATCSTRYQGPPNRSVADQSSA